MAKLALKVISGLITVSMCSLLATGCGKNDEKSSSNPEKQQSSVSSSSSETVNESSSETSKTKNLFPMCIKGFPDLGTDYIQIESYDRTDYGYKFKLSALYDRELPAQGYVNLMGYINESPYIYDIYNCYLSLDDNLANGEFQKVNTPIDCTDSSKTVYAYVYMPELEPEQLPALQFRFGDKDKQNTFDKDIISDVFYLEKMEDNVCNERAEKLLNGFTHKGSNIFLYGDILAEISGIFEGAEIVSDDTLKFKVSNIKSTCNNKRLLELEGEDKKELKVYAYKGTEPVSFLKFKFDISKNEFTPNSAENMTVEVSGLDISKYDKVIIQVYDTVPGGSPKKFSSGYDHKNELVFRTVSDWKDIAK